MHTPQLISRRSGAGRRLRACACRFRDAELERQFILSYRASARLWVRVSLVVALSTVLGFAIIDHVLLVGPRLAQPDHLALRPAAAVRRSIMLVLTTPRWYQRWYQPAIQIAAPLFAAGTVLMAVEATPAQLPLVAARLLLAAFYFYFMLGLTFGAAVRTNVLLIGAYATAALLELVAPSVAIYSLFVLFCANLIGGAGCYALEYANRIAFLERRRLADVAMHDGLTGLLNRAALEEQARGLWQHAQRGAVAGVGPADRYRSLQGLQRPLWAPGGGWLPAAGRQRDPQQRPSAAPLDMVARYGGEEIIAILPGADRAHATQVAVAVLKAVTELGIAHGGSRHAALRHGERRRDDRRARRGLSRTSTRCASADIALYSSKARGRDGWSCHEPAEPALDRQVELLKNVS